ncbi:hypothetical protein EJB05_36306, partial [Eragrostis curvula]
METPGQHKVVLCDDAVVEILLRLPSKSVLRCRAVCKSWLRITTDPSFLATHAARRPREMLVFPESLTVSTMPLSLDDDNSTEEDGRRFLCDPTERHPGSIAIWRKVLYSLDGLLVVQQRPGFYIVCNPMTRQWTNLPVLACVTAFPCGFYLHGPSGEYRLLCHGVVEEEAGECKDYYYILSAGATEPRRLARAPADRPTIMGYPVPVCHRGALLWSSCHPIAARTGGMILAFHTVHEMFGLLSPPPGATMMTSLFELDDGGICAATMACVTQLDIWTFVHNCAVEPWTLRLRLQVSPPNAGFLVMSTVISAGDGSSSILVGGPGCPVVRLYDLKEKKMRKEVHCRSAPSFLVFSESLVSHSFFDRPAPHPKLASIKFHL